MLVRGIDASAAVIFFWSSAMAFVAALAAGRIFRRPLSWRLLRRMLLPGALLSASVLTGFLSVQNTSIMNASLIDSMDPLLFLIGVPLIVKRPLARRPLAFGVLSIVGAIVLVLGVGGTSGATVGGDAWAVVSLLLWVGYFVSVQRHRDAGVDATSLMVSIFLVGFVVSAPLALAVDHRVGEITARELILVALMSIGPGYVAYALTGWAQRHLDIRATSLIGLLSPPIAAIGAWIIYSERLRVWEVVGAVLVLVGIGGLVWEPSSVGPIREAAPNLLSETSNALLS